MTGPGPLDEPLSIVRQAMHARAAVLLIIGSPAFGTIFEVQGDPALLAELPDGLRQIAAKIEQDLAAGERMAAETEEGR